jgi:hypothetical protein
VVAAAGFMADVGIRLLLDREGRRDVSVATVNTGRLASDGFPVSISGRSACVFGIAES